MHHNRMSDGEAIMILAKLVCVVILLIVAAHA